MDQNVGAAKWSRNLSEESQTESNRFRLIEKQRQLLESKLQRQHQVVATSTRPQSGRPVKSGVITNRSAEKLIDLEDLNDSSLVNASVGATEERNASEFKNTFHSSEQLPRQQSIQTSSPLSSPESTSISIKSQIDSKLVSVSQINKFDLTSTQKANISLETNTSNCSEETSDINPLTTILSNEQLLLFATQPISPQKTIQCTIIRDKKGLDRSLYPTYYMHLQAIVANGELDKKEKEKLWEPSSPKLDEHTSQENNTPDISVITNSNNVSSPNQKQSNSGYRQVFLLSGRRRKKSKTYLIGNDPFDISRVNCIAKLKSNVLGTQFTAIRINSNGQRHEIASIIYETNVLGFKGPRKMTSLIPRHDQININSNLSLLDEWKRNNKAIIQLKNKTPIWNDETQSYVLNFHGRVTQASVKNFQLVVCNQREDIVMASTTNSLASTPTFAPTIPTTLPLGESINSDIVSMQFGRVSSSQFSCDVSWPMSLLQAFAIALSSFDSKLACE